MMLDIIFHQVFWVLLSFFLFFFLINKFVIANIKRVQEKRTNYMQKLIEQINTMENKSVVLQNVANKILNEEIPNKQRSYLEKKLEPILSELNMLELNEKQILKERLARHRPHHFQTEILSQEVVQKKLQELSNLLLQKIEYNNQKKLRGRK